MEECTRFNRINFYLLARLDAVNLFYIFILDERVRVCVWVCAPCPGSVNVRVMYTSAFDTVVFILGGEMCARYFV